MKRQRSQKGLVLATSELMIIIPVVVMVLFLIVDTAILACCKLKLGAVAQDSARFIASLESDRDTNSEALRYVEGLLKASCQPVNSLKVKVRKFEINDAQAVSITVEGSYPLVDSKILPARITLTEIAAALVPTKKICGYVAIKPDAYADPANNRYPAIYLPIVKPNRKLPIWTFPYDTAIGSLNLARGTAPRVDYVAQKQEGYFNGLESIY